MPNSQTQKKHIRKHSPWQRYDYSLIHDHNPNPNPM